MFQVRKHTQTQLIVPIAVLWDSKDRPMADAIIRELLQQASGCTEVSPHTSGYALVWERDVPEPEARELARRAVAKVRGHKQ